MIVVVEGLSAAGKSTWCGHHYSDRTLPESGSASPNAPDRKSDPRAAAEFWQEANSQRWKKALHMEEEIDLVVCDTDPFKLHYSWCLFRLGEISENDWDYEVGLARQYFASGGLGFADLVLVSDLDGKQLSQRRRADINRRRRHFDLHGQFGPPLRDWYRAIQELDSRRVIWELPSEGLTQDELAVGVRDERSGTEAFDRFMVSLRAQ